MEWNFGGLEDSQRIEETAAFGVVPVPLERTTSYGRGTAAGPAAIVNASRYLELFDEVYRVQPADAGLWTAPPFRFGGETIAEDLHHIHMGSMDLLKQGKFLIFIGGEHAITPPIVRAYRELHPTLSVLQIDAHADLRQSYEGTGDSHACAMRRVLEICPAVQVGVRSISKEEYADLESLPTRIIFAHEFFRARAKNLQKMLANLSETIYITLDLDGLDPSLVPATGTPEPGGFSWQDVMQILETVFAEKQVVGGDVVELAPVDRFPASDFLAAKLVYKLMAMKQSFSRLPDIKPGG